MSSPNNNPDTTGLAIGVVVLGMAAYFLFALIALFTFVLTILSLMAWRKPLKLTENITIEPGEAHIFVNGGLIGMGVLPVFCLLFFGFLGVNIDDAYMPFIVMSGYIGGSLGVSMAFNEEIQATLKAKQAPPVQQLSAPPEPVSLQPQPFRFARWDDEDERR